LKVINSNKSEITEHNLLLVFCSKHFAILHRFRDNREGTAYVTTTILNSQKNSHSIYKPCLKLINHNLKEKQQTVKVTRMIK